MLVCAYILLWFLFVCFCGGDSVCLCMHGMSPKEILCVRICFQSLSDFENVNLDCLSVCLSVASHISKTSEVIAIIKLDMVTSSASRINF